MKLLFNIENLSINEGGTYAYSRALLKLFTKADEIEKIYLLVSNDQASDVKNEFNNQPKIEYLIFKKDNFFSKTVYHFRKRLLVVLKVITLGFKLRNLHIRYNSSYFYQNLQNKSKLRFYKTLESFMDPYISFINSIPADFYFVPGQIAPSYNIRIPVIIVMHDLQELHFPEFFTSETRLFRAFYYRQAIEESDHIIVSFKHVKDDIIKFFSIEESKISICPVPLSNWCNGGVGTTQLELLEKQRLPDIFILNPASITRHKNQKQLFQAIRILKQRGIVVTLACTGKTDFTNSYYIELLQLINDLDINQEIVFTGLVSTDDLIGLYKTARMVVIPTLYEAGSGPLFEAMNYGAVVICSNVTSLPESIGNMDFVFDPNNPNEMAKLIEKGMFDERFRKLNIENSIKRMAELQKPDFFAAFNAALRKASSKDYE